LENPILKGCRKMFIPFERDEVLRNGRTFMYAAVTKNEDNPDKIGTDGRFPTAS